MKSPPTRREQIVLIILGPPGAGKGTQCKVLAEKLGIPHISTGDLLRDHIRRETQLGVRVKEIIDGGLLVPDELVLSVLLERINESDCSGGFIIDGFPRTRQQAALLDMYLPVDAISKQNLRRMVVRLLVSQRCLVNRLAGRQICPMCQTVYGSHFHQPRVAGYCDKDASFLAVRKDDHEETVTERLRNFDEQILAIVDHYAKCDGIFEIDGDRPSQEVTRQILQAMPKEWHPVISARNE